MCKVLLWIYGWCDINRISPGVKWTTGDRATIKERQASIKGERNHGTVCHLPKTPCSQCIRIPCSHTFHRMCPSEVIQSLPDGTTNRRHPFFRLVSLQSLSRFGELFSHGIWSRTISSRNSRHACFFLAAGEWFVPGGIQ